MSNKRQKTQKRLHLVPLIVGIYGAILGLGLMAIGISQIGEGVGMVRALIGLGMAGFGMYGVWDGVHDLVRRDKEPEKPMTSQFILTDASGNRSSNVTGESLHEQLKRLMESEENVSAFHLQILPPLSVSGQGLLKQVSCVCKTELALAAFFDQSEDWCRVCPDISLDMAEEWLKQLLSGSPDFTGWKSAEETAQEDEQEEEGPEQEEEGPEQEGTEEEPGQDEPGQDEPEGDEPGQDEPEEDDPEEEETEEDEPQDEPEEWKLEGQWKPMTNPLHQLLVIFGESWHDEHKFFSARDLELAVEGVHDGKYQKAVLEWGYAAFDLFPGMEDELMVIWRTAGDANHKCRFYVREGTVTQVNFWLSRYLERGFFEEMSGWTDVTAQIENLRAPGGKRITM